MTRTNDLPATSATARRTPDFGHAMRELWALDTDVLYLNHGTVGAPPRRVLAAQQAIRDEIERQPARYLIRELADVQQLPMRMPPRMRTAAAEVAAFLGCASKDLAFVDNATTGCNAVLRSWNFAPGDEILVADHGYGAITLTAQYVASRTGATVRVVILPYPGITPESATAALAAAIGENTRMLVIDHITSGSSLVLPIADIAARCHARGVAVLVDGAHAPGMLPLDIPALGVDFYTGNLHKWAMAPRPSAFLWAAPERQQALHPTAISWGYGLGMSAEFDMLGTRDPSAWLAAPDGITFMHELDIDAMRAWNHRLVWDAARALAERWSVTLPAPENMFGSMVTMPLPERFGTTPEVAGALKTTLLYDEKIETQIFAFKGRMWLRLAAQVYNDASDFERLRSAIEQRA